MCLAIARAAHGFPSTSPHYSVLLPDPGPTQGPTQVLRDVRVLEMRPLPPEPRLPEDVALRAAAPPLVPSRGR